MRGLRCASLRTVVLNNSYHMISIDNDRQQVVRETLAFAETVAHGPVPEPVFRVRGLALHA
ncbi:hypothetical protein D3C78_1753970 [compost metagenome]